MQETQETQIQSLRREDSPGEGNGNPLQYSCLENSMDRGAWRVIVHGFAKSRAWLNMHKHKSYKRSTKKTPPPEFQHREGGPSTCPQVTSTRTSFDNKGKNIPWSRESPLVPMPCVEFPSSLRGPALTQDSCYTWALAGISLLLTVSRRWQGGADTPLFTRMPRAWEGWRGRARGHRWADLIDCTLPQSCAVWLECCPAETQE